MKTRKILSLLLVAAVGVLSLGAVAVSLPASPAAADPGDGLINRSTVRTLASGVTAYTTTGNIALSTLNLATYGAVQIDVSNVVTGSQVLTVIPQFSNAPVNASGSCASASAWFTATERFVYASEGITPTVSLVDRSFTVTGSDAAGSEIPILGQCFRLKLDFSEAGATYTPTVYIRAVNRQ